MVGVTGTNGKTTTAFLVRAPARGRRAPLRPARHRQARGRRAARRRSSARPRRRSTSRRPSGAMLDGGDRGLRDGGVLARARAGPRRRDPLRVPRLHQPDPGPPRLPRRRWRSTSLAKRRLFERAAGRRSSTSTTRTGAGSPARSDCRDVRDRARGGLPRARRRVRPDGLALPLPDAGRRGRASVAAAGAVQRRTTRSRRWPPRARWASPLDTIAAALAAPGACRGASSPSTRARTSRCWWTTRTRPTRSRTCCAPRATGHRGAPARRVRRRRRPRPRQAPADGRRGRAGSPTRDRDLRQPALRGPRRDHRRDHGRAPGARRRARARPPRARSRSRSSPPQPGDVVVIAGKGHEQGQEFEHGRKEPFDDVTVAREALQRARDRGAAGVIDLTAGWVARAAGGRLAAGDPERAGARARAVIDSRAVEPGDLFVGLRGAGATAGDFAAAALDAGAWGVLVAARARRGRAAAAAASALACSGAAVIAVDDPLAGAARARAQMAARAGREGRRRSPGRPARPRPRTSSPRCCARGSRRTPRARTGTPRSACR